MKRSLGQIMRNRLINPQKGSPCINCQAHTVKTVYDNVTSVYARNSPIAYSLVQCVNCQLVSTYPKPELEDLEKIYREEYSYLAHDLVLREKIIRARNLTRMISSHIDVPKILELGCGSGVFLREARKQNLEVLGVEISDMSRTLENERDIPIVISSAENFLDLQSTIPGAVVLSHTFEHLHDPARTLRELQFKMQPNQPLILVVPSIRNCFGGIRNRFWGYWQVPVHIYHFDKRTLTNLLENNGFKCIRVYYRSGDFLSKGLFFLNIFKMESQKATTNRMVNLLVSVFSILWASFHRFGRSDLILIAVIK